jgi:hypothetical protein
MAEDMQPDPILDGTYRPRAKPIKEGSGPFIPFHCLDFQPQIKLPLSVSSTDPFAIFSLFFTDEILQEIVDFTNQNIKEPDLSKPHSRSHSWYNTTLPEIKVYLGILIYMGLHIENQIEDYWSTDEDSPQHAVRKYMSRNRFEILHRRFCLCAPPPKGTRLRSFERVEPLNSHVQRVSLRLWTPGRNVTVDECMQRFTGRAFETTTVPSKPIPTGYKVWVVAQLGYFLQWTWHSKGAQGPEGVRAPVALGGPKTNRGAGLSGNRTQAVVPHLLCRLPPANYIVLLDNLFVSNKLMMYLRELEFGAIGTARRDSGIVQRLLTLQANAKKSETRIPYNALFTACNTNNTVTQALWNDNAPTLFMMNCNDGSGTVSTIRHKPSETSSNAAISRPWFGEQNSKELDEPAFAWLYNQFMNAVDVGDQLKSYNSGDRPIRRGGWQALWNWLLQTVLVNSYLISIHANVQNHWQVEDKDRWTTQVKFRKEIIRALLHSTGSPLGTRKRHFSHGNIDESLIPAERHQKLRMTWRGDCKACQGERYGERRRVVLGETSANIQSFGKRSTVYFGCKQCNVHLCKEGPCFDRYHGAVE